MPRGNPKRREEEVEEEEEEEFEMGPQFNFDIQGGLERSPSQIEEEARKVMGSQPAPVQNRIKVLRKLQHDYDQYQQKFDEEFKELEKKYAALFKPLMERRSEIVLGAKDVTEEEQKAAASYDEVLLKKIEKKEGETTTTTTTPAPSTEDVKGIPNFWLTALEKSEIFEEMVQEHDKDCLKYLTDITTESKDVEEEIEDDDEEEEEEEKKEEKPKEKELVKIFTINFYFKTNPYFKNEILTKTYYLSPEDDSTIERSKGCKIEWHEGKDLTVTTKQKKQRHKSGKQTRVVQQTIPRDSFFNYFKELEFKPEEDEEEEEAEERFEQLMDADSEIGVIFRDRLIPHAVQYYLGEMQALNVEEMVAKLGKGYEQFEDEEEEEEEEEKPKKGGKGGRGGKGGKGGKGGQGGVQQPAEGEKCQQQ